MRKRRADEIDETVVDALWDHLQTTATPETRQTWERLLQEQHRSERRGLRRLFGRFLPEPRLPPMQPPAGAYAADARPVVPTVEGFFAARDDTLDSSLLEEGPHGRFETVEVKRMDPVKVATLGEILGAGTYDSLVETMIATGREASSGECGLYSVPDSIRDRS